MQIILSKEEVESIDNSAYEIIEICDKWLTSAMLPEFMFDDVKRISEFANEIRGKL